MCICCLIIYELLTHRQPIGPVLPNLAFIVINVEAVFKVVDDV